MNESFLGQERMRFLSWSLNAGDVGRSERNREGAASASTAVVGVVVLADLDHVDGPRASCLIGVRWVARCDEHAPRGIHPAWMSWSTCWQRSLGSDERALVVDVVDVVDRSSDAGEPPVLPRLRSDMAIRAHDRSPAGPATRAPSI